VREWNRRKEGKGGVQKLSRKRKKKRGHPGSKKQLHNCRWVALRSEGEKTGRKRIREPRKGNLDYQSGSGRYRDAARNFRGERTREKNRKARKWGGASLEKS